MKVINPIQMNDWDITKFLNVILTIQVIVLITTALDLKGIDIPIIRELFTFIFLIFVPGILIIRILKIHKMGNIETLIFSVGLSITSLMFLGFIANMVYPLFGILNPITLSYLVATVNVFVLILSILSYVRDKEFSNPSFIDSQKLLSVPFLFLCLMPFLAIIGTYLVNYYHTNILLMVLIIVIGLTVILTAFDRFIPKEMYPFAIFVIGLSLLFHTSLISQYVWGWDVHKEYYFANLVINNSFWNYGLSNDVNAMLSVVIFAPIFSVLSSLSLTWVFKIVYPVLFALVPIGIYAVVKKQTNDKIAFLSCFFFVSFYAFFIEMLSLARQEVAELFLVALVLIIITDNMDKTKKAFLYLLFSVSIIVSHYALSYIYLLFIIPLSLWFFDKKRITNLVKNSHKKYVSKVPPSYFTLTSIAFFLVFTIAWYIYVSGSSPFVTIVKIGNHISTTIFTDFLNQDSSQGLNIILKEASSPLRSITKYLQLIAQLFIAVGVLHLILKRRSFKLREEYKGFVVMSFILLIAGIAIPFFASSLNTSRLYQISLIFLAPICVIGGITLFKVISKWIKRPWTAKSIDNSLKILSIFFVIILLFNTGFAYEVAGDSPQSIALSQQSINMNDLQDKSVFYTNLDVFQQSVDGAVWLGNYNIEPRNNVYVDYIDSPVLWSYGGINNTNQRPLDENISWTPQNTFIYLGYPNVIGKVGRDEKHKPFNIDPWTSPFFQNTSKVYTNGGCQIYFNNKA